MDFVRKFLDCEEVQRRDADRERGEYVVQSREVAFAIVCVFVCVCVVILGIMYMSNVKSVKSVKWFIITSLYMHLVKLCLHERLTSLCFIVLHFAQIPSVQKFLSW